MNKDMSFTPPCYSRFFGDEVVTTPAADSKHPPLAKSSAFRQRFGGENKTGEPALADATTTSVSPDRGDPGKYPEGSALGEMAKQRAEGTNPFAATPNPFTRKTKAAAPKAKDATTTTVATSSTTTPSTSSTTTEATATRKANKRAKGYENVPALSDAAKELAGAAKDLAAAARQKQEPPAAAKQDPNAGLSRSQVRSLKVMETMEQLWPDRYPKGFAANARKVAAESKTFETGFLKDNPNASDDEIADALADFEEKNGVNFEDGDFQDAAIELANGPLKQELELAKAEVARLRGESQDRQLEPVLSQNAATAVQEVAGEFGAEFTKLIKPDGSLDSAGATTFIENHADPELAAAAVDAMHRSHSFAEAAVLMFAGKKTKLQDQVVNFCFRTEKRLAALSNEEKMDENNRTFIPRPVYNKEHGVFVSGNQSFTEAEMAELIDGNHPSHWILSPDVVITLANDEIIARAKQHAEQERQTFQQRLAKRGYQPAAAVATTLPPARSEKPDTVSSTSSGATAAATARPVKPNGGSSLFRQRMRVGTNADVE